MNTNNLKKAKKIKQLFYIGPGVFVGGVSAGSYFIYKAITSKTWEIKNLKSLNFQKPNNISKNAKELKAEIKKLNEEINKLWNEISGNKKIIKQEELAQVLKEFFIFINNKQNYSEEFELYDKLQKKFKEHNLDDNTIEKIKKLIALTSLENANQNKLKAKTQKKSKKK